MPSKEKMKTSKINDTIVNDKSVTVPKNKIPFSVVEAYKNIRTNFVALLEKDNKKIVVITSPNASEGKSTTAINTAVALTQIGKKVLLIDTDAHRPSVHIKLKLSNDEGLMNVLAGNSEFKDVLQKHKSSLDVLTTGPIPTNSTELFSTPVFDELLKSLSPEYDFIILDAPPINLVSDALVLARKSDGIILVVRAGVTEHDSLRHAISSTSVLGINILGVILNGTDYGSKKYYKKYYKTYNYYNHYG